MNSILTSIKKLLGIDRDYTHFDADIIMHINSVFMTLQQIGVGPEEGFFIFDESSTWSDFLPKNKQLEAVKSYMYLKVRLVFDPPTNGTAAQAMEKMAAEWEWRLNIMAESGIFRPEIVPPTVNYDYSSVLGKGVLGRMILGSSDGSAVKPSQTNVAILSKAILGSMKLGYTGG